MKRTVSFALLLAIVASGCTPEEKQPTPTTSSSKFGYTGDDNLSTIPTSTNISFGTGSGNLPASVDLVPKFPPIGDQGQYGTCVSWAVGYNMKTAIEGIEKGYSSSQLSDPSIQLSPKDLFTAIPDDKKGQDCNGTNFAYAFDVVQQRGVATMQAVPYTNLGNCNASSVQASWNSSAAGHKIKSYRKIEAKVDLIKEYLSKNIPVVFGAKLADNFMTWNSDNVLSSNTTYDQTGIHAYHALIVAGYDNSKGPGGAFKVINSWGSNWGSAGYIWIDYNFFISQFCTDGSGEKPLFVADNGESTDPPGPSPTSTGVDLAPWIFEDQDLGGGQRGMYFNVYNIGNTTALPSSDWNLYYIYYNAYDAEDYGLITYDEFNTSVAANTLVQHNANEATFNFSIPANNSLTNVVWGTNSIDRVYYMPNISGYYYLVMIADGGNAFSEGNEMNNLFYTTENPKYFQGGVSSKSLAGASDNNLTFKNTVAFTKEILKKHPFQTAVNAKNPNAYRPDEIVNLLKAKKKTGDFDAKVRAHRAKKMENGGFKLNPTR